MQRIERAFRFYIKRQANNQITDGWYYEHVHTTRNYYFSRSYNKGDCIGKIAGVSFGTSYSGIDDGTILILEGVFERWHKPKQDSRVNLS